MHDGQNTTMEVLLARDQSVRNKFLWFLTRNCFAVVFGDKPSVHSKYGGKEGVCFWPRRVFGELPPARGRSGAATVSTSSLTVPFQKSNKLEFSSRLFSSSTVGPPLCS